MNRSQWIALASAMILVIACFMPWAHIGSAHITVSGTDTAGTRFGKPAYLHFVFAALILLGTFIKKIWVKRLNLLFAAMNLGWAIKNFIAFSGCEAGDCPQKKLGLFLVLIASAALLVTAFFPNMKIIPSAPEPRQND